MAMSGCVAKESDLLSSVITTNAPAKTFNSESA